jgi:hypothetical protein
MLSVGSDHDFYKKAINSCFCGLGRHLTGLQMHAQPVSGNDFNRAAALDQTEQLSGSEELESDQSFDLTQVPECSSRRRESDGRIAQSRSRSR